jgi:hypothetical protein
VEYGGANRLELAPGGAALEPPDREVRRKGFLFGGQADAAGGVLYVRL